MDRQSAQHEIRTLRFDFNATEVCSLAQSGDESVNGSSGAWNCSKRFRHLWGDPVLAKRCRYHFLLTAQVQQCDVITEAQQHAGEWTYRTKSVAATGISNAIVLFTPLSVKCRLPFKL